MIDCCTYPVECLGCFCNCQDIVLPLMAPESAQYTMKSEFAGGYIVRDISVSMGQPIVIPNVFNEHYLHIIQFFKNGELINDTAYSISISSCVNGDENTGGGSDIPTVNSININSDEGVSISDERMKNRIVTGLIIDSYSLNTGYEKPYDSDTLILTDGNTFGDHSSVTIIFE